MMIGPDAGLEQDELQRMLARPADLEPKLAAMLLRRGGELLEGLDDEGVAAIHTAAEE